MSRGPRWQCNTLHNIPTNCTELQGLDLFVDERVICAMPLHVWNKRITTCVEQVISLATDLPDVQDVFQVEMAEDCEKNVDGQGRNCCGHLEE